jgi:hypothetical protein
MKSLRRNFAAFAAVCLLSAAAFAADPTGTWKWTQQGRGGGGGGGGAPRESTLTLAMKDGKLTGKLTTPGRGGDPMSTEISDASVKGDDISFSIEREFNGNKFVSKYTGKLEGDSIKGSIEAPGRDGAVAKRDWTATRAK